jgi:hypothetical protein
LAVSATNPTGSDVLIEIIVRKAAELAAEIIVARLRHEPGLGAPLYATAQHNPLGSKRAFLNAARAKKFTTFKRGRNVAAMWSDVDAWMRQCPEQRRESPGELSLEEELAMASKPKRVRRHG